MTKKEYWLALWWWAARGFTHIWVIKYIEENNIKIKEISWTSMWAIIGSLYALWYSSEKIKNIANNINYFKLVDIDLKKGIIKWKKLLKELETIFWNKQFWDTKIKLKIVATNLESGEKHIFSSGKIIDAIRASISLPWIIEPFKIDNIYFVDWWITENLPISVLKTKNIIASSVLKIEEKELKFEKTIFWIKFKKSLFSNMYLILHKTIIILMNQNENLSIIKAKNDKKIILLLTYKFNDLDYYSFNKIDNFIQLWYSIAKKEL